MYEILGILNWDSVVIWHLLNDMSTKKVLYDIISLQMVRRIYEKYNFK